MESVLGRGGMGEVYVGYDETLRRQVALKSIRAGHRLSAQARARFVREAQILSRLDHPNICKIHDFIEDGDRDYLVLELVKGRDLATAIRAGLEPAERLPIAREIAAALVAAHAEGIVHRDLKPENVMLTDAGEVKVLDFGLARPGADDEAPAPPPAPASAAAPEPELPTLPADGAGTALTAGAGGPTMTLAGDQAPTLAADTPAAPPGELRTVLGTVMGTLTYMSPEQARGEQVTTASDMYSFGLVLQTLFTGRGPYPPEAGREEILARARAGDTLPVTGVDADLTRLIDNLESPAPAPRPTAVAAAERLRWIADRPKRRVRRLAAAAALAILVAGGLKYTFDLRRERTIAVEARDEAELRRGQAEDLIGFMLGDLRTKLTPLGRLEILDDVGHKALDYFASLPPGSLSDDELARRSNALNQIGEVRMAQGDLDAATQAFQESLTLARGLAERDPDNDERQVSLGAAYFWVGYAQLQRGDFDGALARFRDYYDISKRLAAKDPDNAGFQLELAYSHSNLAAALRRKGDLTGAIHRYEAFVLLLEELVGKDPGNLDRRRELADGLSKLGMTLKLDGRWEQALLRHDQALEIRRRLLETDPEHTDWRWNAAISHHRVGVLQLSMGRVDEAVDHFETDRALTRSLVERDPTNTHWSRSLAVTEETLGLAALAVGDSTKALGHFRAGVQLLSDLASARLGSDRWRPDLAGLQVGAGTAELESGDPAAALARAEQALATLEPYVAGRAPSPNTQHRLATAHNLRGLALDRLGRRQEARDCWRQALAAVEALTHDSNEPRLLDPWATALLHLDRLDEARPILARLDSLGYRRPGLLRLVRAKGLAPGSSGVEPARNSTSVGGEPPAPFTTGKETNR